MIKARLFETTEPRTGTRTLILQAAAETDGMGWVLEVTCPEGHERASWSTFTPHGWRRSRLRRARPVTS
jgi:hypothetical protein